MFTQKDLTQLAGRGIDPARAEEQLKAFRTGFPYLTIDRAAVVGDGILKLTPEKAQELAGLYGRAVGKFTVEKFVPASGAASRMFKELYEFVGGDCRGERSAAVERVLEGLDRFAFYEDLVKLGIDMNDPKAVIGAIVEGDFAAGTGLGLGKKPKGLIKFHKYADGGRTAMEEHLVEVALYGGNPAKIHFTVSPEHMEDFKRLVNERIGVFSAKYGVEYEIDYSVQEPATDTIAVNPDNTPFREGAAVGNNGEGDILFRPGGHGALIENLNRIDADLIFIKTVDNVVPDHLKGDTVLYKKALAAVALDLQQRVFSYLKAIDSVSSAGTSAVDAGELRQFIEEKLCYRFPSSSEPTLADMRRVLDRPLRVCGMVRNEGEPGGGPFWARTSLGMEGALSLQIAESSQIDPAVRQALMGGGTHFNPVDLVCAVRDFKGRKFDLTHYVDRKTGFISEKSKDGRSLKALELPGLWNGAMADWNTVFVEVPITTFAPVKTVADLLRPQHQ
ncbi:DUF4301 family protein [uncultured Rikenella sp.]|uniref:DUF4301 family protein n=1 Tax=uncultured Rikenella sp. TaxID=368003 RepID=UPI0026287B48|nr:DUF4301 family protein [uncultured Rikenella sp.]